MQGMQTGAMNASRQIRPMDRIATAADRVERICSDLAGINERFHGSSPVPAGHATDGPAVSYSYISNIDRLAVNIERLEQLVATFGEIA